MAHLVHRVAMFAFVLLCAFGTARAATTSAADSVTVPSLTAAPHLNGVIDASWKGAATIDLGWDYTYRRPAQEPTTVYLAQYEHALYVAWDVHQRAALTINQNTNGGGVYGDDHVGIAFYPQGSHGFMYIFRSNPLGTRDQFSSENSAYAPQWESAGRRTPYGYVVTMRIPLDVIRSGGSRSWRVQFTRKTTATNEDSIWTHDPSMQGDIDVNFAGTISGIELDKTALRPPARLQFYGLGEMASKSAGGNASRIGADLSVPITSTSSFVATLHPDYSNVEIDQQSIAPQEFPRFLQDVRPFFTQIGSQFNGRFNCYNCVFTLYTPSIPQFAQGYAVEGAQGPATFAAFDAIGAQRTDDAQTFGLFESNRDHLGQVSLQRVSVNAPGVHDVSTTLATGYSFAHNHLLTFANFGNDRGTLVTDPSQGGYQEYGVGTVDQTSSLFLDYQHVGSQFTPLDGFVGHPGIDGVAAFGNKGFNYSPKSSVEQLAFNAGWDSYQYGGRANQADVWAGASVRTRSQLGFTVSAGSSYLLVPDGEFLPFTQDSIALSYRSQTTTPSSITYAHGRYYHGFLGSWYDSVSLRIAKPLILSLEADTTHYVPLDAYGPSTRFKEIAANELLERASLDWQMSRKASLDMGVRRISGIFAPTGFGYVPTTLTKPLNDLNVTAAFHFLALRNEFYVVYGDPSRLSTQHALFFKWIRYVGAPKGT